MKLILINELKYEKFCVGYRSVDATYIQELIVFVKEKYGRKRRCIESGRIYK